MMESLIYQFQESWLFFTSILVMVVGLFLLLSTVFSKLRTSKSLIQTRQHKSAVSERLFIKGGFIFFVLGIIGLLLSNLFRFGSTVSSLNENNWYGEWSVYQEEFGDFGHLKGLYELEFKQNDGKIEGTVFNERGRNEGYLSSIHVDGNCLKGKYGRNDGRKMEVEFLLFPDGNTFIGRYKERHGKDYWRSWVSHKL